MTENPSENKDAPPKGGYLRQAWLIIVLSVLFGGILAWTQLTLGPIIEKNKKDRTYRQIPVLVEGADAGNTKEYNVRGKDGKEKVVYHAHDAAGKPLGWVFPGSGQGFADVIELLVGLDENAETITGIFVLSQKETPGLGNFIQDKPEFAKDFVGLSATRRLEAVKTRDAGKNQITMLTGATISSQSVCDIVNAAVNNYRDSALKAASDE